MDGQGPTCCVWSGERGVVSAGEEVGDRVRGRRDGFASLVSGLLLLLFSGLGLLAVGVMAIPGALPQQCFENGPFPPSSSKALEGGGVAQHWQWAPMGLRCEWLYPDGSEVTVSATSWTGTAVGAGVIVGGAAGAGLVVAALARQTIS
jgi:hypothetical protein